MSQPRRKRLAPICAATLVLLLLALAASCAKAPAPKSALYYCPMHPNVTADHPGDCPICGMHLVKRDLEAPGGAAAPVQARDGVVISPERRTQMGLTLGTVERRTLHRTIWAPSRVVPDETRIYRIISRIDGYVNDLYIQYAGQAVRRDESLVSIFNLSFQSILQQFLGAPTSEPRRGVSAPERPTQDPTTGVLIPDGVRQRLRYWNMSDEQIARILKTGKPESSILLVSPSAGYVTEKDVVVGQKVSPGDLLFVITDLGGVWAEADVSEMDAPSIKVGMPLSLTLRSLPGREFKGKVKFFQPILDPQSKVMKVYAEMPNPGLALKPGMIGTAHILLPEETALAVPEGAAFRTGERSYVFVDAGSDRIEPREVVLGGRAQGCFEVISGVKEGERVVTSAAFLVDSESSLKAALRAATEP